MPKTKSSKKLIILIWDMGIGGVQKRVRDITLEMDKKYKGWKTIFLIQYNRPGFYLDQLKKTTKAEFITSPYFNRPVANYRIPHSWILKEIHLFLWIVKYIYLIKPDVVLTFLDQLSVLAVWSKILLWRRKFKLVLNEGNHTSTYLKINRDKIFFWKLLIKKFYPYADKIIVPTKAVKEDLTKNFAIPKSRIFIVHNWTLFREEKSSKKIYDLIFIGRLAKEKNPLFLTDLINKLKNKFPNIKLIVLGTGNLINNLKKQISKNKLSKNILLNGYTENVRYYLKRSKILVLPTVNEGFPNVVLEAAACKVPSLIMDFPGADEIIRNRENGFIAYDFEEFIKTTESLLLDNTKIDNTGKEAFRNITGNFSLNNQEKFIKLIIN